MLNYFVISRTLVAIILFLWLCQSCEASDHGGGLGLNGHVLGLHLTAHGNGEGSQGWLEQLWLPRGCLGIQASGRHGATQGCFLCSLSQLNSNQYIFFQGFRNVRIL